MRLPMRELSVIGIPHGGVATALNRGLAAARAELIARMDADDVAIPERLERQVAALQAQPEIAVLGAGMEIIDADDGVIGQAMPGSDPAMIRKTLLRANCLAIPRRLDTEAVAAIVETVERASCWEPVTDDLDAAARLVMGVAEAAG